MNRLQKILLRLVTLAISGGLALAALEGFLRWREARALRALTADPSKAGVIASDIPGLYYTLRPGASNDQYGFNSLGFNMAERSAAKPAGTRRIVVVGDSVVQGVGAGTRQAAYPNRTETLLREALGSSAVEVWNCGTGGYNVDQVFLMLSRICTNFSPDAVVYGFCFNDYWGPNLYVNGQAGAPPGASGAGGRIGLLDRVKQLRTVALLKDMYDRGFYRSRGYLPVFVDRKIAYPSWQAMKQRIVEMRDFCRDRGWPFAVCIVPMPQFIHVEDARNLALHDLRAHLATNGIPFCDTTPALRAHATESLFVPMDNHPDAHGYDVIAQDLSGWLLTNRTSFLDAPNR